MASCNCGFELLPCFAVYFEPVLVQHIVEFRENHLHTVHKRPQVRAFLVRLERPLETFSNVKNILHQLFVCLFDELLIFLCRSTLEIVEFRHEPEVFVVGGIEPR